MIPATFSLYSFMNFESMGITIGGIFAGVLCGLIPLVMATNKRSPVLGVLGFLICTASGIFLGLILAAPVAFFMAIYLSNRPSRRRRY